MYDYLRRFLIAMAVALSIFILFLGATVSFANEHDDEVINYIWPTVGLVTDTFGTRNGKHYGIDIAAPRGTDVVSVSDGVVTKSYYSNTYGNVIFIEHTDGYETIYAHLHKRLVEEGTTVYQGEQIGTIGNTGRSRGDHLHFEIHDGNWTVSKENAIDPLLVIGNDKNSFFVLSDESTNDKHYQVASASNFSYDETSELEAETFFVMVKKGDNLWSIAKDYGASVNELMSWNELSSERIYVNQQLKIVPKGNYLVQQGDSLWQIAEKSGTTVSSIKQKNNLHGDLIKVGRLLKVE